MIHTVAEGACRIADIGDLHAPHTDPSLLEAAVHIIREFKPHLLVVGGDTLEAAALSTHLTPEDREHLTPWHEEIEQSLWVFEEINAAVPRGCKIIELEGNHEGRNTPRGRRVVSSIFEESLRPERVCPRLAKLKRRWTTFPYTAAEGYIHVGAACFLHGFGSGAGAARKQALRCRQFLSEKGLAFPEIAVVRHHQHNLIPLWGGGGDPIRVAGIPIGIRLLSPGTLGPQTCSWDPNFNDSEWAPGICILETAKDGSLTQAQTIRLG